MCGILGLVRRSGSEIASTAPIAAATTLVRHRGPDDEGYLLWTPGGQPQLFAGDDTAEPSRAAHRLPSLPLAAPWTLALGHRRLAIVDLSPGGYQPMIHRPTGLAVAFNGEIYNHVELRQELERCGHRFHSQSDTEVLLASWAEWGAGCLDRLNGMFAFLLLDPRNGGSLHAVRDRFGVKPLYWGWAGDLLAFASEVKQIRHLPGFTPHLDLGTTQEYLATGALDHSRRTFDARVEQLLGGERAIIRLDATPLSVQRVRWYTIAPRPFRGSLSAAADQTRELLSDSVRLRLRADVPVGSCLSGGLDSSAIVCLGEQLLRARERHAGQITVTARFEDEKYDEWRFAAEVIRRTGARAVEVWPSADHLKAELDQQLWHMDEPFGSTSQFSQWCVFHAAAEAGLKVMLDGQGSDEQLAGYAGNDAALYTGLLRHWSIGRLATEIVSFRQRHGLIPIGQLIFALRNALPFIDRFLPQRVRLHAPPPDWLRLAEPPAVTLAAPRDLNDSLLHQTLSTSLPVLLRYEDRNSMARSIEARVPFLDYRLVEFLAGLPPHFKLRRGLTKVVLREALAGILPDTVRGRRDKMGFVTPEQMWLTRTDTAWFRQAISCALDVAPELFHADRVMRLADDMIAGRIAFSFTPWRILCFGRWLQQHSGLMATSGRTEVGA